MKVSQLRQLIREEIKQVILNEGQSTNDKKTIRKFLKDFKDGIYILKGGLEKDGGWNEDSLQKGTPLYYTPNFNDPKLKSFQKDGIVKVDIEDGEANVAQY